MVKQPPPSPSPSMSPFFGFNCQGNFGPFTIYVNRHRKMIWYLTTPQKEPPTYYRDMQKRKLAAAAAAWNALSSEQRATWILAAGRLRLRIPGYDLWTYLALRPHPPT